MTLIGAWGGRRCKEAEAWSSSSQSLMTAAMSSSVFFVPLFKKVKARIFIFGWLSDRPCLGRLKLWFQRGQLHILVTKTSFI